MPFDIPSSQRLNLRHCENPGNAPVIDCFYYFSLTYIGHDHKQSITLVIKSYTCILLVQQICICWSCSNFEKGWKTQANSYESIEIRVFCFLIQHVAYPFIQSIGQMLCRCAKFPGYCIIEVDDSLTIYPFVLVSLGNFLNFVWFLCINKIGLWISEIEGSNDDQFCYLSYKKFRTSNHVIENTPSVQDLVDCWYTRVLTCENFSKLLSLDTR